MALSKYIISGIAEPGMVNVKVNGRFQTISLYSASEEVLCELYEQECPYVKLQPQEFAKDNNIPEIKVSPVEGKKRKTKSAK